MSMEKVILAVCPRCGQKLNVKVNIPNDPPNPPNVDPEKARALARAEILALAEKMSHPENYTQDQGYSNLAYFQFHSTGKQVAAEQRRKTGWV